MLQENPILLVTSSKYCHPTKLRLNPITDPYSANSIYSPLPGSYDMEPSPNHSLQSSCDTVYGLPRLSLFCHTEGGSHLSTCHLTLLLQPVALTNWTGEDDVLIYTNGYWQRSSSANKQTCVENPADGGRFGGSVRAVYKENMLGESVAVEEE